MVYTPQWRNTQIIPAEPAVLSCYLNITAAAKDLAIYIPWEYCQLDYSYAVALTAEDGTGNLEIDLELDAASGTEMHSLTLATSAAVGTIAEGTVTTVAACKDLGRHNTDRDAVNIETETGVGTAMLYMYFISDNTI